MGNGGRTGQLVGGGAVTLEELEKRFADQVAVAGIDLDILAGEFFSLLGPSGCGKTTTLRMIAGFEQPTGGRVLIDGVDVSRVPPDKRPVNTVFQSYALFPHLNVHENVAFGLRFTDASKTETRARASMALEMVRLTGFEKRKPHQLSGGQQQRVALARALAPRPSVLLLDEPFSNLDTTLRVQVRTEVHRLLVEVGITTVFVTHDQDEAFVLGDEVAVMHGGVLVQQAPPSELYAHPATPWVAGFVGDANLVPGHADGAVAHTAVGPVQLAESTRGAVEVLLRPESLEVGRGDGGVVELVEFYGHDTVYGLRLDDGTELRARAAAAPELARGDRVDVAYAGSATVAFPATSAGEKARAAAAPQG